MARGWDRLGNLHSQVYSWTLAVSQRLSWAAASIPVRGFSTWNSVDFCSRRRPGAEIKWPGEPAERLGLPR